VRQVVLHKGDQSGVGGCPGIRVTDGLPEGDGELVFATQLPSLMQREGMVVREADAGQARLLSLDDGLSWLDGRSERRAASHYGQRHTAESTGLAEDRQHGSWFHRVLDGIDPLLVDRACYHTTRVEDVVVGLT